MQEVQMAVQELRAAIPVQLVHTQLLAGGEPGGLTDATMQRWLTARKMNVAVAAHDLTAHAAWRATWTPCGRVLESEVQGDIAQRKVFLQGPDRQGRGLAILHGRKHTLTDNTQSQRFISLTIDGMLATCDHQRNPQGKIVAVFELQDLSLRNLDAVGLKNIFHLLQQHYVEVLDKLYMVNASSLFWGLWRVVSPLLDPVTRSKVVFLSHDQKFMLVEELGPEVLPPELGGTGKLVPIQDAWQQLLQQKDQQTHQQQQQQQLQAAPAPAPASGSTCTCTAAVAAAGAGCGALSTTGTTADSNEQQQGMKQPPQQQLSPRLRNSGEPGYVSADAAVLILTA